MLSGVGELKRRQEETGAYQPASLSLQLGDKFFASGSYGGALKPFCQVFCKTQTRRRSQGGVLNTRVTPFLPPADPP